MALSEQELEHMARLTRLALSDDEKKTFRDQLSSILEYVALLQKVDTSGIEYHYQVEGLSNVMAKDEVISIDEETRMRILDAMPKREDDLLKVKGVFEK
jgi:aspartyl-tRNA(Asn)/glutamyl-tRNA(Gln) amidotransferase subunit C